MRRFRNPRYAPEFLERKLSPSGVTVPPADVSTTDSTDPPLISDDDGTGDPPAAVAGDPEPGDPPPADPTPPADPGGPAYVDYAYA